MRFSAKLHRLLFLDFVFRLFHFCNKWQKPVSAAVRVFVIQRLWEWSFSLLTAVIISLYWFSSLWKSCKHYHVCVCVCRCWRTTTTAVRWTGGVWVWWCTRWCAAVCRSITRITSVCSSSSWWRTSASLERSRPTPNPCCPACSRKTPNNGHSTADYCADYCAVILCLKYMYISLRMFIDICTGKQNKNTEYENHFCSADRHTIIFTMISQV